MRNGVRGGFALPTTLGVLAVAAVAVAGMLGVAMRRIRDSSDAARLVRIRSAAESAVRVALATWDADSMRGLAPGGVRSLPGPPSAPLGDVTRLAEAERLDDRRFVVRVAARSSSGPGTADASASVLVTTVPPDSIWRDFPAAVTAAGDVTLGVGAVVSGMDTGVPAAWSIPDCLAGLAAFIAATPGGPDRPGIAVPAAGATVTMTGASVSGRPPVWPGAPRTDTSDFQRLGPLPLADVAAIADRTESGMVRLGSSVAGGVCDRTAPGNWGEPGDPTDPCFDYVVLVFAASDLEITAGSGQGILVVHGNVTFRDGTAFTGLVLATGRVELEHARITGAIRAAAGLRSDGIIESSACAVARVLLRTRALRMPFRFGDRLWLPPF